VNVAPLIDTCAGLQFNNTNYIVHGGSCTPAFNTILPSDRCMDSELVGW
jgi:hypothetical protein